MVVLHSGSLDKAAGTRIMDETDPVTNMFDDDSNMTAIANQTIDAVSLERDHGHRKQRPMAEERAPSAEREDCQDELQQAAMRPLQIHSLGGISKLGFERFDVDADIKGVIAAPQNHSAYRADVAVIASPGECDMTE